MFSGLQRQELSGSLVTHTDLSHLAAAWNEIVVGGGDNTYVKQTDFDLMADAEPTSGAAALVTLDGSSGSQIPFPSSMITSCRRALTGRDASRRECCLGGVLWAPW